MSLNISFYNPNWSKFILYADLPIRHAARHLGLAWHGDEIGFTGCERASHVAKGILKLFPVVGYCYVLADKFAHRKSIHQITLNPANLPQNETNAYNQGLAHGQEFKGEIKKTYDPILYVLNNKEAPEGYDSFQAYCLAFEAKFPQKYKDELKGLAEGSGYSYEQVVMVHTFLDASPNANFGCSAAAVINGVCVGAANHYATYENGYEQYPEIEESISRKNKITKAALKFVESVRKRKVKVLKSSDVKTTIQSIMFDISNRKIHLSAQESHAAKGRFKTFATAQANQEDTPTAVLFRNLDWPWYFLGRKAVVQTRVVSEETTVTSVTFPGYIGTLSGMNNHGLTLSICSNGSDSNPVGLANPLLFTQMLETCKSVQEALDYLAKTPCGSSMNVVIADDNEAVSIELGIYKGDAFYNVVSDTQPESDRIGYHWVFKKSPPRQVKSNDQMIADLLSKINNNSRAISRSPWGWSKNFNSIKIDGQRVKIPVNY